MERIALTTDDGINLVADYYAPTPPDDSTHQGYRGVILLHMMPATRESWRDFAPSLAMRGCHVIAPDLRGHGESQGGLPAQAGPDGYRDFSEKEHQASINDVQAACTFLKNKGVDEVAVIGASIGANLAIQLMAENSKVTCGAFLSPGLNYKGIKTLPLVKRFAEHQKVLFAASEDDRRDGITNAEMAKQLIQAVPKNVESKLVIYTNSGHGTTMFGKEEPDLALELVHWIAKT